MREYEFRPFDADGKELGSQLVLKPSEVAARQHAGRIAKAQGGPCDLAEAPDGTRDWDERYLTTASPSEFHKTGFRFERLA